MAPFKSSLARSVGKLLGVYREGDLSLRGEIGKMDDVYKPMLEGINNIMDAIVAPIGELKKQLVPPP